MLIRRVRALLSDPAGGGRSTARHRTLGDAARDQRRWRDAATHYRQHLDAEPKDFAIWVQLGHALKESGDSQGAEEAYLAARALDDEDADLLLNLGHLMKARGTLAEAAYYYRRSALVDNNAAARGELAGEAMLPHLATMDLPLDRLTTDAPRGAAERGGAPRFVGVVDKVDGYEIRGWALDPDNLKTAVEVEFVVAGKVVAHAIAHRERSDVEAAGFGARRTGFSILVDSDAVPGTVLKGIVRLRRTGEELSNNPVEFTVPAGGGIARSRAVTEARAAVVKRFARGPGEHAVFVAHAPTGMLKPFVRRYLAMLRDQGIGVLLVVNADRPVLLDDGILALVDGAIVRDNLGYDFGAWAQALLIEPSLYGSERLYIINDSVFGPKDDSSFAEVIARVRTSEDALVGMTQTLERGWHLQSYFFAVRRDLLASYAFQLFVNEIEILDDKDAIIDRYEVQLAARAHAAGFSVGSIFSVDEARNPTLYAWRELLAAGFPFVKMLLVKGDFPHIDTRNIRLALGRAGFELDRIDEALRYGTDEPSPAPGFRLLAKPVVEAAAPSLPAKPYRVAFYGPWNYDNGLGSASRGIIAAIRQTGVRLSLHPIKKSFHIHKPLVPDYDVLDFDGPADIAVVHLNPDSWHLLTAEQRREIDAATRRIGYWVWEMDHIPPAWRENFSSVDRIWSPSSYCAELFAAQDEAPVDVVPHAVPVEDAELAPDERARILDMLGLHAAARTILYVFDGSSYLVRKNPAALIRAFGASGLAGEGWTLILKTKHLRDRPEEGDALAALAGKTPGVLLLDRSLAAGELHDLVAAVDIYASPHCSEGFGLTVAEAMAMGKTVVATDFSGTRDFVDASSGFPVRAERWTLTEDFGHYVSGNSWARIDEGALAEALTAAAARIAEGDRSIGIAARERIARDLSYASVGAKIAASFDALVADARPVRRMPPRLKAMADAGIPLGRADFGKSLTILPLRPASLAPENDGLKLVADKPGLWALIAPADVRLHPMTRSIVAQHAAARPDVAIFYGDDLALGEPTLLDQLRLKPALDLTLFAAQDYIGAPLVVRGSAFHELGGFDPAKGAAALTDLVLRALERGMGVERIPEVLAVHMDRRPSVAAEDRRALIARSPLFAAYDVAPGRTPATSQLIGRFAAGLPPITLCVPTRRTPVRGGEGSYVERFLESVATVDWPHDRLTVLIGDDVRAAPAWARRRWPFTLRRIETPRAKDQPFNYSAKMNQLWRAAQTELIVLMNDDVLALDDGWLKALATFAVDGGVGGVGARLLYDDRTIQHAGTIGGIFGTSVHAWLGRREGAPTYQDWAITQREWSIVTGAVFATRKSVLERIGGFDEGFSLEFNDIDLCLKIRSAGLRIVCTPFAEMIHSEKASRGETQPPGDQLALFLSRWHRWLDNDPAFHPRMRRDMLDLAPNVTPGDWFVS